MPNIHEQLSNASNYFFGDIKGLQSTPGSRNTHRLNAFTGFAGASLEDFDERVVIPESLVQSLSSLYAIFRRDPTLAERFAHFMMLGLSISRLTLSTYLFFNHESCSFSQQESSGICDGIEYVTLTYVACLVVIGLSSEISKQPYISGEDEQIEQIAP